MVVGVSVSLCHHSLNFSAALLGGGEVYLDVAVCIHKC